MPTVNVSEVISAALFSGFQKPCHDNRVSLGWTKIGSPGAIQKGSICD